MNFLKFEKNTKNRKKLFLINLPLINVWILNFDDLYVVGNKILNNFFVYNP